MINPHIFREYDIRGIADTDLDDAQVRQCSQGFGTYYRSHKERTVIIGQDVRTSSPRIANTLSKGLIDTGCDVIDIGQVPTPVLYFALHHFNIGNGIMITASHNPKEFNGFKICYNKTSLFGDQIKSLYRIIEKGDFGQGKGEIQHKDIIPAYITHLVKDINITPGLKVAIDTGNGTCGPIAAQLMERIGADYTILFEEPDGNFPNHLPDPTVTEHISELIDQVKKGSYICGIGFDGDGDRIGVLDEHGEIIWGDVLLAIYAENVLKKNPGAKIIFEVKCSKGLIERIEALGGIPIMYKTGHSLIKAKMKEEDSPLAGEMSGHIFFADRYFGFDDALYASLRFLELLSASTKPSQLAARVPKYYSTPEIRVATTDEKKFDIVNELKESFKQSYNVIDIDGVRVNFGDGWGLVRPSNTQPVLVLRFEANTEQRLEEIKNLFLDKLHNFK
jgi:phosphomannomutase/phosphoglucomutase